MERIEHLYINRSYLAKSNVNDSVLFSRLKKVWSVVFLLVFITTTVLYGVGHNMTEGSATNISGATTRYIVQPGDTLWKIANNEGQSNDVYGKIRQIEHMNRLNDNSYIYPGQLLWIPKS